LASEAKKMMIAMVKTSSRKDVLKTGNSMALAFEIQAMQTIYKEHIE
jgi:hypothetical protein